MIFITRPLIKALFILATVSALSFQAFPFVYDNYTDPLDVGVCPRALGMGRAYTAAADDVNSIFMNPAGLSYARNWGVTAGFTSVRNDTANAIFGIYFSTSSEGFGLGLMSSTSWNPMTAIPSREPVTGRGITQEIVADSFSSSVAVLSYGVRLGKYADIPVINDTSFGISFKGFFQQLESTDEVVQANGLNVDVGLIYRPSSWFKFGLFGQNVLRKTSGGKIAWSDGYEGYIPDIYKAGISTKILGKEGLIGSDQDLLFNLDAEQSHYGTREGADLPILYHGGFEWWPMEYIALRFGLDQSLIISPTKREYVTEDNYTGGIGLKYGDFGADYAYHKYGEVVEDAMHYASVSYAFSGFPEEKKEEQSEVATEEVKAAVKKAAVQGSFTEECLAISRPADRSIIYTDSVIVSFEVINSKVTQLEINGNNFQVSGEAGKTINAKVPVPSNGKFAVKIGCLDGIGTTLREYKIRLIRMPVFMDVPENHWARKKIVLLAALDLLGGYPDGTFKPNKTINRAELVSLLVKASGYVSNEPAETGFKDVKNNNWAAFYIKKGVDLGFASGYENGTFKPLKAVTRAEGVSIISRFAGLEIPGEIEEAPFEDVPPSHWASESIAAAKNAGLLGYLKKKPFGPSKEMTRAEVAEVLSQTKLVFEKETELNNWDKGF
jgi:hypothetical protein